VWSNDENRVIMLGMIDQILEKMPGVAIQGVELTMNEICGMN
jgi:hypothetical protein